MNRKSFLKTSLGSLAALSLPLGASHVSGQTGILSKFAFDGTFKFGEVYFYGCNDEGLWREYFKNIVQLAVKEKSNGHCSWVEVGPWALKTNEYLGSSYLDRAMKSFQERLVIVVHDITLPEELASLKKIAAENKNVTVMCVSFVDQANTLTGSYLGSSDQSWSPQNYAQLAKLKDEYYAIVPYQSSIQGFVKSTFWTKNNGQFNQIFI